MQHQQRVQPQQGFEVVHWFTTEIDFLRERISQLQQERDSLQTAQLPTDELESLKAENAQLKAQLQDTQSRLDGIHQLLGRTTDATSSPASSTTPKSTAPATPSPTAADSPTPAADSPTAAANSPVPKPVKSPRSRSGDTAQKINQIVDALIRWNSHQQDNQHRLPISISPVKALASAIGVNYQATIQQVFQEREPELNQLHARFMLGVRHNASVQHKQQLLQAIALVSLSTKEYRTLNDQQRGRLAQRETKYFTSATAQTLVDRATSLLVRQL